MSSLFKLGDPLNLRMSGVVINQPDLPHWATDILQWLGMVHGIQQSSGKIGHTYREQLKMVLDGTSGPVSYTNTKTGKTTYLSGPAAVYGVYQGFCLAIELEANR